MNTLIDVAISLAFVFLLFSIIVSGLIEILQMVLKKRATFLYDSLSSVFNDRANKNYTQLLYNHPLVGGLKEDNTRNPHYIPAQSFADALIDVVRTDSKMPGFSYDHTKKTFVVSPVKYGKVPVVNADGLVTEKEASLVDEFNYSVEQMKESDLKQLLRTFAFGVKDYAELKAAIIIWFNDYMGGASTAYKRWITRRMFIIGLIVAVAFNINAISLTQDLYRDKSLRDRVVNAAIEYANKEQAIRDAEEKAAAAKDSAQRAAKEKAAKVQAPADTTQKSDSTGKDSAGNPVPVPANTKPEAPDSNPAKPDSIKVKVSDADQWKADLNAEANRIRDAYDELSILELPIGWSLPCDCDGKEWYCYFFLVMFYILKSIPGWFITGAALSYGADNWFNLLTKLINIRTVVKPKNESGK